MKCLKNMIAEQIMKAFEVPPTRANWIIRTTSDRFREFKSRLDRDFMYKSEGKVHGEPPDVYDYIDQNHGQNSLINGCLQIFRALVKKIAKLLRETYILTGVSVKVMLVLSKKWMI